MVVVIGGEGIEVVGIDGAVVIEIALCPVAGLELLPKLVARALKSRALTVPSRLASPSRVYRTSTLLLVIGWPKKVEPALISEARA